jgi:6-phosphogluconate dehydrogenase
MKLGMIGLGKMGEQMVIRLIKAGHEVVVTDLDKGAIKRSVDFGAVAALDRADLVAKLGESAVVWVMIPAQFVTAEIQALVGYLPKGSIIIDGGNSDYRQTVLHAKTTASHSIELVDVGTSGGVLGLEKGFSMMVGGSDSAIKTITPVLDALAQVDGWAHFGSTGSGHFIKMVHNGIEYGIMEAYAEGYHVMEEMNDFGSLDLAKIAGVWQHGSIIASSLNEIVGSVLRENPTLEGIDGYVAESGEARWTIETAKTHDIEVPVIEASLAVRKASARGETTFATKLLAAMRHGFGGHKVNK